MKHHHITCTTHDARRTTQLRKKKRTESLELTSTIHHTYVPLKLKDAVTIHFKVFNRYNTYPEDNNNKTMLNSLFIWFLSFPIIGALQIGKPPTATYTRRAWLATTAGGSAATCTLVGLPASARAPGSKDVTEAITQIQDAARDMKKLQQSWSQYATIDAEGRAGSTDAARRILGGIAPQSGTAAIEVAKSTPLYRIDGAFSLIRTEAVEGMGGGWAHALDLITFDELADRILFAIQKADGDFYSVLFAAKGTKQIAGIFSEAKAQVDQGILDFDKMIFLLKDAGAPGL